MNPIIAWFVRNSVAANLLMAMIVLGGLTALPQITQKPFPDIEINIVSIGVEYLGAAPAEVEEGVCIRIEEAIEGVEGIEGIRSTAVEGACAVMAELVSGADPSQALDDIKNRVDAIDTFPEEAEKPVISQVTTIRSVIDVAISGEVDELNLRAVAQRVRDEIAELPGITQVEIAFSRPFEISIEVSEDNLRRYGLSFDQVAAAVRRSSLDLPGGSIKTGGGEILLRTKGQAYRGHEFDDIVVVGAKPLVMTDYIACGKVVPERIADIVGDNDVVLFMKGTPLFPQCGFSSVVVQVLDYLGVDYVATNVLEDQAVREGIKVYSDWPTIPQLYVKGEFVGGSDIMMEMFEAGELQQMMDEKQVAKAS